MVVKTFEVAGCGPGVINRYILEDGVKKLAVTGVIMGNKCVVTYLKKDYYDNPDKYTVLPANI